RSPARRRGSRHWPPTPPSAAAAGRCRSEQCSCQAQALSYAILAYVNDAGMRAAHLGDFTLTARTLLITAVALVIGGASAVAAFCLLRLIGLITNAVFYQRLSTAMNAPGAVHHPAWLILLAPAAGGLAVGLMARYGSDK